MRICHIITRLIVGGAQENTILTCKGLIERGHQVQLLTGRETGPEGSLWTEAQRTGCTLDPIDPLRRAVHPIHDLRAVAALRRAIEKFAPDVVHTHSSKAGILGREAAHRAAVPVIVHTIHGMSFNRTQTPFVQSAFRFLERRASGQTDMFIAVAQALVKQAIDSGIATADRCRVIYSGIDTDLFRPNETHRRNYRREWKIGEDEVVIGSVARLFPHKGYEDLLNALPLVAHRMNRLRFVWIGAGPRRRDYQNRVKELHLEDRVRFVGLLSPRETAAALNAFDLLVHASRWEGLPRAVVQALLCEIPVICYDADGAPEIVIDDLTGRLVPLGDEHALAGAMIELAGDRAQWKNLGRNGRSHVLEQFDWKQMVNRISEVYEECRHLPKGA